MIFPPLIVNLYQLMVNGEKNSRREKRPGLPPATKGELLALLRARPAGLYSGQELAARYGRKRAALPGGFYEWIVDARVHSKETIYHELEEACAYALKISSSDSRTVARLTALF